MEYTHPTTEGGSPLPLTGYSFTWPIEMTMGYTFEDLIQKFGYRIQDAIRTPLYYGKTGLDGQTMKKKTKWWKFWNYDIRKAYIWYTGEVYYEQQPDYVFRNSSMARAQPSEEFINHWNNSNEEYSEKPVNPDYYMTLKLMNDYVNTLKTDPPSEVFSTLAPEHPENSAVKKKIRLPSPRMKKTPEHSHGLLDHSFKQKLIIPIKKRKSGKTRVNETLVINHIKK